MATARRLYLYGLSGAALALLVTGLDNLIRLLIARLGPPATSLVQVTGNPEREGLSVGLALVAVGLPLWLVHWRIVERGARAAGEAGDAERRSIVRAIYFGLASFGLVAVAAASTASIVAELLSEALHETPPYPIGGLDFARDFARADLSGPVTWAVIGWGFFAYHWFVRSRDVGSRALSGGSASVTRLYLYGTAFVAALQALQAAAGAVDAAWVRVAYPSAFGVAPISYGAVYPDGTSWRMIGTGSAFVVWGAVWLGHLWYARRRFVVADAEEFAATEAAAPPPAPLEPYPAAPFPSGAPDAAPPSAPLPAPRGERQSRMRTAYLAGISLAGAIAAGFAIAGAGQIALAVAFGGDQPVGAAQRVPAAVDAVLVAVPYLLAWAWHARSARRTALVAPATEPNPARISSYLVALAGVVFTGYGIGSLVFLVLSRALGAGYLSGGPADAWRGQVAVATAQGVAGLVLWLWPWLLARTRLATPATGESDSTARRWYLCAVCGISLVATAAGAAIVVYQTVRVVLGEGSSGFGGAISGALAAVLVAGALFAIHAASLRRDLLTGERRRAERAVVAVPVPPPAPAYPPMPPALRAAGRVLVIAGPPGADLDAVGASLAGQLPEGFSLEIRPAEG